MLFTVAGVMLVTTELSQATLELTMEAMEAALSCGSRALMRAMVSASFTVPAREVTVAGEATMPGMMESRSQFWVLAMMVLTVAGVMLVNSEDTQAALLLIRDASMAALSCGSRVLMRLTVAGSLIRVARLAVFRPGMRVPVR